MNNNRTATTGRVQATGAVIVSDLNSTDGIPQRPTARRAVQGQSSVAVVPSKRSFADVDGNLEVQTVSPDAINLMLVIASICVFYDFDTTPNGFF